MSKISFRRPALGRLAALCLGTSALTGPGLAASYSVGGGTITTTQADTSADNTGSGGGFALQANTAASNDAVAVNGVVISGASGRALDVGGQLSSSGSYSVTMHGSTLTGGAGGWFQSVGGLISLDTTGGTANTMSGVEGLTVTNGSGNGGVALNLGADTITSTFEAVQAIGQGTGTISIDMAGTTVTSTGTYGIVAQNGLGNITIGGLNGGLAGTINATSGTGILTGNIGNQSITLASSGVINAATGINVQGNTVNIDSFGTINATGAAITALNGTGPVFTITLESSSVTKGAVVGGNQTNTFNIVAGADISNATFNGNGGTTTLDLQGAGTASLDLSKVSNIQNLQKDQAGTWTISGARTFTAATVNAGILKVGSSNALTSSTSLTVNGGTFDLNGNGVAVGPLSGTGGAIALGTNLLSTAFVGTSTLASVITGIGGLATNASGTLVLTGTNTYTGGTNLAGGTLQLGNGGTSGSILGNVSGFGALSFNRSDTVTFGGIVSGNMYLRQDGSGTTILTGTNSYAFGTIVNSGTLQLGTGGTLGANAPLTINGGTLDLNNTGQTVGSASGGGGFITLGSGTLTTTGGGVGPLASTISGTGSVTVNGGRLILTAANTYTGGTTVNAGSLELGSGGTTGSVAGNITDNSVLVFNRSNNMTFGNVVSGSGLLIQQGTGILVLAGANTYTGGTEVEFGNLQIGNGGTTGSIVGNVTTGEGNLIFDRSDNVVFGGVISGTNGPFQAGGGTLTLTGANTFINTFGASNGTLILGSTGALTSTNNTLVLSGTGNFITQQSISLRALDFNGGDASFAVATGKTASVNLSLSLTGTGTIVFGSPANAGTITLNTNAPSVFSTVSIEVAGGTLRDTTSSPNSSGGGAVSVAALGASQFTVDAGAIVDFNDHSVRLNSNSSLGANLQGAGQLLLGSSASTEMRLRSTNFSGTISGAGSVTLLSGTSTHILSGTNSYTGGTTINSGATLQLGTGGTTGSVVSNVIDNGSLIFNRSDNPTFANIISGIGSVTQTGPGGIALSGNNTYSGGTTIVGGTLQIGVGGAWGSIGGNIADNGSLAFDRSDALNFAGIISGAGAVKQIGTGALTVSGIASYTGATTISSGTLNVTGSIAGSSVSVASSATLSGTGKVGTTTVASGGTLAPGASATPGTLSISGNLTLASGSDFADAVTPTAASLASVSGAASINGAVVASITPGAYSFGQRFPILTATGGVSGTFASLIGIPATLKGQLSYDANNVYLNLSPTLLAPLLAGNTTTNQHNVVAAIDAAVSTGSAVPSGGFNALYGLTGASLNSAVDQISGQVGPNVSNSVGQSFLSFLAITAAGGAGEGGSFAPGSAYGSAAAPHRAQLDSGQTRAWGGAYGGHVGLSADAASGAAALSASNVGLIGGADMRLADGILAGVTLGWGRQHFNSGNGSGISTDYAFGLYGRADAGAAYVTAAFGYGWHQITTLRVVTVSGTDVLQGKQNADDFGGRIEAGWRMALDDGTSVAPYGAFAGESFESPAYAETALSGASTFALSYASHATALGRSELGAHLDRNYDLGNGSLAADVRAAWAHQLDDVPFTQANFENLATASFEVLGVRPARDTALLGADLELRYRSGLFLSLRGEGQFGAGTTILEGLGSAGLRW